MEKTAFLLKQIRKFKKLMLFLIIERNKKPNIMSSYSENRKCSVCGAPISDNNPDGIGCECRRVFKEARVKVFFEDAARRNSFYGIDTKDIASNFIELFKNTKFRSDFKKTFYASICEQYNTRGYLSKKQKQIMEDWLFYKNEWSDRIEWLNQDWKNRKREMIQSFEPTSEEQEHIRKLANKLRHS